MLYADVSGVFRGGVVVRKRNSGFVVTMNFDQELDELAWNVLNDVQNPQQNANDMRQGHVFGFGGAHCD